MAPDWLESIRSAVPRGFSRYYVMDVLQDGPRTGREIIRMASDESGGRWRPSPGLIYPLLARLLEEGMIAEHAGGSGTSGDDGRHGRKNTQYEITSKGARTMQDIRKIGDGLQRQIEVITRLGGAGRFAASDILERVAAACTSAAQNTAQYRQFLIGELERLDRTDDADTQKDGGAGHAVNMYDHKDNHNDDDTGMMRIDVR